MMKASVLGCEPVQENVGEGAVREGREPALPVLALQTCL